MKRLLLFLILMLISTTVSNGENGIGAVPPLHISDFKVQIWQTIPVGTSVSLNIDKETIAITKVSVNNAKAELSSVEIEVWALENNPVFETPVERVYQYLLIDKKNIADSDVNSLKINFRIQQSWLADNNIASTDVSLYRYKDAKWNRLVTKVIGTDNTYVNYEADTPGFSYFAIGSESITEDEINQCSYPSKVDCNTKEEADMVISEWAQGKCSKEASLKCIEIWTKSQPQCTEEWKCDGNYKYYQNSECSVSNKEYCQYGCENGVCKSYERRECVNGVAYWYKGDSLYETPENCFVQGKICVEGQCVTDQQCTKHIRTDCYDNDVYWFGDCGNGISDKYMECGEAGCSNGKCATTTCTPSWNCDSWSSCTNGKQTRACTDKNNCGTYSGMPATSQICATNYNFNDYPLILIHGLWSDASSMSKLKSELTWYYDDKGTFDKEPDCKLLTSVNKPIIISYQYHPTKLSLQTIQGFSYDFSKFISRVLQCTGAPKVDIIAHSLGGTVSRYSIKTYNTKVNKLIMLGTPNQKSFLGVCQFTDGKKRMAAEYQLLQGDIFNKLNVPPEACCGTDYFVIRGNSCSFGDLRSDGVVTIDGAKLNGAKWVKDVNCAHTEGFGNDKQMISPSDCPQAYNYITEALGKSTTSSIPTTENAVKDKTGTPSLQPQTTNTRYCYKRFLGFLWCTEYRYK